MSRKESTLTGRIFLSAFLISLLLQGCSIKLTRELHPPRYLTLSNFAQKKMAKVHMKDGSLYLLDSIMARSSPGFIEGNGILYDQYRDPVPPQSGKQPALIDSRGRMSFRIPSSEVALVETNTIKGLGAHIAVMALVAAPSFIITIFCLTNPKACFGSCPTFYTWNGKRMALMAEGFSSSILSAFEKEDTDMLYDAKDTTGRFHIEVRNEALETHVIKKVDLIAIPKAGDERILSGTDGNFYKVSEQRSPGECFSEEGSCLDEILNMDHVERYSVSDEKYLGKKEDIELVFRGIPEGQKGLAIGCRQTLMTTYLFYQGLAYLGNSAGFFASRIESGDKSLKRKVERMWDLLGGIEVFLQNQTGRWEKIAEITEAGPIAADVHLVKLPAVTGKDLRVRLRMTKGLWRIDYLSLGKIENIADPLNIRPVVYAAAPDLCNTAEVVEMSIENPLVTFPGDVYDLYYNLPSEEGKYEYFLNTRGYYLEWMRESWIAEENHRKAVMFFLLPRVYLKRAAGEFKLLEPSMEESFWNSKYVKSD